MENARKEKHVSDSLTEQVQVIMPQHLNGHGTLFGGQLAAWIDVVAGVVAGRHSCGTVITTAAIDSLVFHKSVGPGAVVTLMGRMTYVGRTSMEVRVDSYVDRHGGGRELINTAFVIEVALDCDGKPCAVPVLVPVTPEEKKDFAAGEKRREIRRKIQRELYE